MAMIAYGGVFEAGEQMVMLKLKDVFAVEVVIIGGGSILIIAFLLKHLEPRLQPLLVRQECVA